MSHELLSANRCNRETLGASCLSVERNAPLAQTAPELFFLCSAGEEAISVEPELLVQRRLQKLTCIQQTLHGQLMNQSAYHFLNSNHTFLLRVGHVVAPLLSTRYDPRLHIADGTPMPDGAIVSLREVDNDTVAYLQPLQAVRKLPFSRIHIVTPTPHLQRFYDRLLDLAPPTQLSKSDPPPTPTHQNSEGCPLTTGGPTCVHPCWSPASYH